jgi:hypothetical protein
MNKLQNTLNEINDALLVRCGSYIYNVTSEPVIYNNLAH